MVLWTREEQLQRISQNSFLYATLYYVLLFSKDENSWHPKISIHGAQLRKQEKNRK